MTRRSSVGDICPKLGTLSSVASLKSIFCTDSARRDRFKCGLKVVELDLRSDLCGGCIALETGPSHDPLGTVERMTRCSITGQAAGTGLAYQHSSATPCLIPSLQAV